MVTVSRLTSSWVSGRTVVISSPPAFDRCRGIPRREICPGPSAPRAASVGALRLVSRSASTSMGISSTRSATATRRWCGVSTWYALPGGLGEVADFDVRLRTAVGRFGDRVRSISRCFQAVRRTSTPACRMPTCRPTSEAAAPGEAVGPCDTDTVASSAAACTISARRVPPGGGVWRRFWCHAARIRGRAAAGSCRPISRAPTTGRPAPRLATPSSSLPGRHAPAGQVIWAVSFPRVLATIAFRDRRSVNL